MTVETRHQTPVRSESDPSTVAALCPSESTSPHHQKNVCDFFFVRKQPLNQGKTITVLYKMHLNSLGKNTLLLHVTGFQLR